MQIRWKADWLCEATGFSSSTSECQALSEGRRACPAQTDGRKAGEKNKCKKQMVKTFPPGGRDGRINGRQTKQRNHGNKSMSTADQREGERGWKQNLVVDLVVTRFYSRESTFYKLFFWAYRVLVEILKTAPLNTWIFRHEYKRLFSSTHDICWVIVCRHFPVRRRPDAAGKTAEPSLNNCPVIPLKYASACSTRRLKRHEYECAHKLLIHNDQGWHAVDGSPETRHVLGNLRWTLNDLWAHPLVVGAHCSSRASPMLLCHA